MAIGDLGPLGQHVARTARGLSLEVATIHHHSMGAKIALDQGQMKNIVQVAIVQLMAIGDIGPPGHHVAKTAKDLSPEVATIQHHTMEERIALDQEQLKNHVQEVIVQLMANGDIGPIGPYVTKIVRDLNSEVATIHHHIKEEKIVMDWGEFRKNVLEVTVQ